MAKAISLENISFSYNGNSPVLEDINLQIEEGDFLGVIGPNGGGKTTLLKIMMGLLKASTGKISLLGKEPCKRFCELGYVPQFVSFERNFPISVLDLVLMGRLHKTKLRYNKIDKEIATRILTAMKIVELVNKPIRELSGGQLQRAMIARALACEPKILLLDEPTANIDMHGEQSLYELLQKLRPKITIIVVSHDIGFISKYVDKVACVNKTLVCHTTLDLTPSALQQLYHIPIKAIDHCTC